MHWTTNARRAHILNDSRVPRTHSTPWRRVYTRCTRSICNWMLEDEYTVSRAHTQAANTLTSRPSHSCCTKILCCTLKFWSMLPIRVGLQLTTSTQSNRPKVQMNECTRHSKWNSSKIAYLIEFDMSSHSCVVVCLHRLIHSPSTAYTHTHTKTMHLAFCNVRLTENRGVKVAGIAWIQMVNVRCAHSSDRSKISSGETYREFRFDRDASQTQRWKHPSNQIVWALTRVCVCRRKTIETKNKHKNYSLLVCFE